MPTLYKVYAMALTKRLKKETERKGIIPRTGFRERNGTINNIYVINYVAKTDK